MKKLQHYPESPGLYTNSLAKASIREKKQKVMKVSVAVGIWQHDKVTLIQKGTVTVSDRTNAAREEQNLTCRQAHRGNLSISL